MKVFRERPDQRQHHRVTAPLNVSFGGNSYRADNWSLGGIKISNIDRDLPKPGEELLIEVSIPFQGFDINFSAEFKVVRNDADSRMIAGKFVALGERERDLMQLFIEDLIRGSMSDTRDTIQRIDVPVTPISTKPDIDPGIQAPVGRWSRKTIFMTLFYVLAGIGIFGYLILMIYTNFVRLEVRSAIITRPVIVEQALADSRVEQFFFKAGDQVKEGDLIAELYVPKIQAKIDEALVEIKRREGSLARAKKSLGNGKRLALSEKQIDNLRLDVSEEEDELEASQLHLIKLSESLSDHNIRAPFDAKIIELRKPAGSNVIYKEPILILERSGPATIEAYLSQEQVMKIALDDEALFYVPSLKVKATAKIVSVNRTSSNLDESSSRYLWQNPDAKTALVTLEILTDRNSHSWPAGLPATVSFKRHRDKTPLLKGENDDL